MVSDWYQSPLELAARCLDAGNALITRQCVEALDAGKDVDALLRIKSLLTRGIRMLKREPQVIYGLADKMKPIIEAAAGVLEDAMQFETDLRKGIVSEPDA